MLLLCNGAAAAMLVDHGSMHGEDLEHMSDQVRRAARDCQTGEIEWPLPLTRAAVGALAAASRNILGLDIRDYDAEGRFVEVAWSEFEPGIPGSLPQAVESSRRCYGCTGQSLRAPAMERSVGRCDLVVNAYSFAADRGFPESG